MDTNNWRPAPGGGGGGEPTMDAGDWRTQLQPDSRLRIVNKIMDTLKRHLPFSGVEGLQELKKIAVRFEEKIYTVATSQPDYLRKISQKMLTMKTKSQNTTANSLPSNSGSNSENPPDTVYLMDTNNWRPAPGGGGGEPAMDAGDWRTPLHPDSRQRIVNKIMDTLKRHIPFPGQEEGLPELQKIAARFEEKTYTAATSQPDYLRRISVKMLIMETKSQDNMTTYWPSNSGRNSKNPLGTGMGWEGEDFSWE